MRYPADPPTVEEIVAVMRAAGDKVHGRRLRGLIVVLRRAGLRLSLAPSLGEADPDARRGSVLVRRGKGGRRRSSAATRAELRRAAEAAGVRRRFAQHQLRRAHAVELPTRRDHRHRPRSAPADDPGQHELMVHDP